MFFVFSLIKNISKNGLNYIIFFKVATFFYVKQILKFNILSCEILTGLYNLTYNI